MSDQSPSEKRLRRALDNEEFVLHYQPKYQASGRALVGLEALLRWQGPGMSLMPPAKFLPALEKTAVILPVGAWVLRRAALDHRAWMTAGLGPPRVAVNVSTIELQQPDFVRVVQQALPEGVSRPALDIEITESSAMADRDATVEKLRAVRKLGIDIAIDDFGTGHSSLFQLARLPLAALKIDRSFVGPMVTDPITVTLVHAVISASHALGLKVVAEGVETEEQARLLRLLKCDHLQGYLLGRPLPAEQVPELLKRAEPLAR